MAWVYSDKMCEKCKGVGEHCKMECDEKCQECGYYSDEEESNELPKDCDECDFYNSKEYEDLDNIIETCMETGCGGVSHTNDENCLLCGYPKGIGNECHACAGDETYGMS